SKSTRVSLDRPPLWLIWRCIPGGSSVIRASYRIGRIMRRWLAALNGIHGLNGCALEGSPGLQNGNLLPDLVAQIGGEILDVVDGIDDHRVGQMLRIERGEL